MNNTYAAVDRPKDAFLGDTGRVNWPSCFYERLRKPIPSLSVHDWRLTGLDVNRGLNESDITGMAFAGKAAAPAQLLAKPEN
jgi:hypothetical protein